MVGQGIESDASDIPCGSIVKRGNVIHDCISNVSEWLETKDIKIVSSAPSLKILLVYRLSETLTSLSTPLLTETFAIFHNFMMRMGKEKALALLCARINIALAMIATKFIFTPLTNIFIKTSLYVSKFVLTPVDINFYLTTAH